MLLCSAVYALENLLIYVNRLGNSSLGLKLKSSTTLVTLGQSVLITRFWKQKVLNRRLYEQQFINIYQLCCAILRELLSVNIKCCAEGVRKCSLHDYVIKWKKHFSALLAFCVGIHRSPVNSPHKGQWRGALMFSLNKRLSKQWCDWRFDTSSRPLWRHSKVGENVLAPFSMLWECCSVGLIYKLFLPLIDKHTHVFSSQN